MPYTGFDELSTLIKGLGTRMNFAKTSNEPAGVGYSTRAPKNRRDNFHVKWHPAPDSHVVDRFHVKNEDLKRSIYYGVTLQEKFIYFRPGPNGPEVSYKYYDLGRQVDLDLLDDCDDIAKSFLKTIQQSTVSIYNKLEDAEKAYEERQEFLKTTEENRKKKSDLADAYARAWPKLSQSDQQKNPKYGPVEIRQFSFDEIQKIYDKILSLLPPSSVPEESRPKMTVPLPMPTGYTASPGATAIIEKAQTVDRSSK